MLSDVLCILFFFFSSRRRHTICALVTGVQTCALPILRQITERAKNWNANLIVVGTDQPRGLKRLLLGSTSTSIASRAHCSVRVIPAQDISWKEEIGRASCRERVCQYV